jgi:hypothetical protein
MKHAWLAIALAIGCGGSSGGGGEPQLGNAMVVYNGQTIQFDVGSAVLDTNNPANMLVQIGSDHVTCSTDLDKASPGQGTYAYFSANKTTPGANPSQDITVIQISSNHLAFDLGQGSQTITSIDTRVMGSLTFTFTDTQSNVSINVSGTFDVKKCF